MASEFSGLFAEKSDYFKSSCFETDSAARSLLSGYVLDSTVPDFPYKACGTVDSKLYVFYEEVTESVQVLIKYGGYIQREKRLAEKILRLEDVRIPVDFDYSKVTSLSIESRQKLLKHRPQTIAQASRIPGVSPADISVLLLFFGR